MAAVANHLGYDWDTSLTIGKVFAGLNAQAKGRMIGIFSSPNASGDGRPKKYGLGEGFWIRIGGRGIPMKSVEEGARAVVKDKPIDPKSVQTYLEKAFGDALGSVREAMEQLAKAYPPDEIDAMAFSLYEKFRPKTASGQRGWGLKGKLDLGVIRGLAPKRT
jgi:hypothetical protein